MTTQTAKHTPGPWKAYRTSVYDSNNREIARSNCGHRATFNGDLTANANLIASAPELLEACRLALKQIKRVNAHMGNPMLKIESVLNEAIAKAEGRNV